MRRKVLLVAPFCSLVGEPYFNRFLFLAELLSRTYDVTLVTSRFRHFDKLHRTGNATATQGIKLVLLDEPGYVSNVSIRRAYSHYIFRKNFEAWFCHQDCFDVVYSAYPLIGTNAFLAKRRRISGFKFIVDIQDVWPESIVSAFPVTRFFPKSFLPFSSQADFVYRSADAIIAVSETYLERALSVASPTHSECVYIGADFELLEDASAAQLDSNYVHFCYVGTLSYSYDLITVVQGIEKLALEGNKVMLHIFGGGPEEAELRAKSCSSVVFHGFVPYTEMISFLKGCQVAINPIRSHASQTVTNKLSDYLAIGMPVLNSQEGDEISTLLLKVGGGSYKSGSVSSFVDSVRSMLLKQNFERFPNPMFDRSKTYLRMVDVIESLCDE